MQIPQIRTPPLNSTVCNILTTYQTALQIPQIPGFYSKAGVQCRYHRYPGFLIPQCAIYLNQPTQQAIRYNFPFQQFIFQYCTAPTMVSSSLCPANDRNKGQVSALCVFIFNQLGKCSLFCSEFDTSQKLQYSANLQC